MEGDGLTDVVGRAAIIALLEGDDAEQVQGVRVFRLDRQYVAVPLGRFTKATALVLL